jgi:glycerophosphoryl diester phosphodiesterase
MNPYALHPTPHLIAHRGGGGLWPENTLTAFERVAALPGVVALETDIHATRDGVIVAAHDETLERISDGAGLLREQTWEALQRCDYGYHFSADHGHTFPWRGQGCQLPTLATLFERFGQSHIINIDIKQATPPIVAPLVALIAQYGMADRIVVGSFFNDVLADFRRRAPQVATAASQREVLQFWLLHKVGLTRLWRGRSVVFQIPEWSEGGRLRIVTPGFVRALHARGQQIHVWTVNESADMARLLAWGVDGIVTDYPDRLLALLAADRDREVRR